MLNPTVDKFTEDNPNITMLGFAWACYWRLFAVMFAIAFVIGIISEL